MKIYNCNNSQPEDISELKQLSEPVLAEIVREAEAMVASQYQSHVSSEQRGLAIFGFCLTTATALAGAYISIDQTKTNGPLLSDTSLALAIILMLCGMLSGISIWPRKIDIPGNEPKNWLPKHWPAGVRRDLKQTRLEQCLVVQQQIFENRKVASLKARLQQSSMLIGFVSVTLCIAYIIYRVEFVA